MIKKGDTLIEVTLAVGIFSMIAIAIVAVMSNGTSNAQTSLESTLAREEVDSQTEALRFIQSSAIIENDPNGKYSKLWDTITKHAITKEGEFKDETIEKILQYSPESCDELYDNNQDDPNNIYFQKAFVIDLHQLGKKANTDEGASDIIVPAVVNGDNPSEKFGPASTYPRLVYSDSGSLVAAEGIYIIAVADYNDETKIATGGNEATPTKGFYDFYIRTCWYGSNAEKPSLVSTVIRLYNPAIVKNTN